ncbi:MAG: DJ-1/PfpI family protein [Oscillospiraceae bacterium]|nr:DJ-1/PfpI family protein [Oscillospiraceae bacterium]
MTKFNTVLFDGFETLDAFGPIEVMGHVPGGYEMNCFSLQGGTVESKQNVRTHTLPFAEMDTAGVLLIPGGIGVRPLLKDDEFMDQLRMLAEKAPHVLTVCTGSVLLAQTGLLNGRRATSNKMAFAWASSHGTEVDWIKQARWVQDGKYYTASGVSAGIDMTLGFVRDQHGLQAAEAAAGVIEYVWNQDADHDPFAVL